MTKRGAVKSPVSVIGSQNKPARLRAQLISEIGVLMGGENGVARWAAFYQSHVLII